jgi:phosphoribosylformylglycinamidine synthase
MIRTCVITGYGINAQDELASAFELAGTNVSLIHITDLMENPGTLKDFQIIGFPGGFSYGDHLGSGLVLAHLMGKHLREAIDSHIEGGGLIIGICNGFQVLTKMGVLPNTNDHWEQEVSLIHNDTGVFENSWVRVTFPESTCVWTNRLPDMDLPIRHGEGRFITISESLRKKLSKNRLIALQYKDRNPNGSQDNIAGITDRTGQILGLMPHPEAFIIPENHPRWTREKITEGWGLRIIAQGVRFLK